MIFINIEPLREIVKKNGMTFAELERELGFGNGTIGKWENSSPTIDKLLKVAQRFDLSIDCIVFGQRVGNVQTLENDTANDITNEKERIIMKQRKGVYLVVGDNSPTYIGRLTDFDGIPNIQEVMGTTTLNSKTHEQAQGLKDKIEIALSGELKDPTILNGIYDSGEAEKFSIIFLLDVKAVYEFKGLIARLSFNCSENGAVVFTSRVVVSGKPLFCREDAALSLIDEIESAIEKDA